MSATIQPGYFDALFETEADPWGFATSPYEAAKYQASLAALPHARYANVLEIGCANGVMTALLARRCDTLVAMDASAAALRHARAGAAEPHVSFVQGMVPQDLPLGPFDLVAMSEVLYYLSAPDLAETARQVRAALNPGGVALLVNYLGDTSAPHSGDEAAAAFIAAAGLPVYHAERAALYRIDVLGLA